MNQAIPVPPVPPLPPSPVIAGQVVDLANSASPADVYQAYRAQRRELSRQMESLEEKRRELTRQLQQTSSGTDRSGLEQRLADVDQRIIALDKAVSANDAQLRGPPRCRGRWWIRPCSGTRARRRRCSS